MCVEYVYLTAYLCQHLTCEGSSVGAAHDCRSCGEIRHVRLRKEVGAPTTPCQWCRDHGVWVLHRGRWMTRRESDAWRQMEAQKQQIDRWMDGYMDSQQKQQPRHAPVEQRRQLSVQEAAERVTAVLRCYRAAEQLVEDDNVLPSIEDPQTTGNDIVERATSFSQMVGKVLSQVRGIEKEMPKSEKSAENTKNETIKYYYTIHEANYRDDF